MADGCAGSRQSGDAAVLVVCALPVFAVAASTLGWSTKDRSTIGHERFAPPESFPRAGHADDLPPVRQIALVVVAAARQVGGVAGAHQHQCLVRPRRTPQGHGVLALADRKVATITTVCSHTSESLVCADALLIQGLSAADFTPSRGRSAQCGVVAVTRDS